VRVVVTRPEISAVRTAERLKAMGHDPVLLPLSEAFHHPQIAEEALRGPYSALAVTSAEAMRVLSAPGFELDVGKTVFAVGDATAAAASSAGFREVHAGAGDGKDLAEMIASFPDARHQEILYLAGKPRAATFEDRLGALGISVRIAEIYEMITIDHSPADLERTLSGPPAEAVLLYSQENAARFFDLLTSQTALLSRMRVLCISARAAAAVPEAFSGRIEIAQSPTEDALLALL
jgi:uroporphyrinogen-III synthase